MNVFSSTYQPTRKQKRSHFARKVASENELKNKDYKRIVERSRFRSIVYDPSSLEIARLLSNGFLKENYDRIIVEVVQINSTTFLENFNELDESEFDKIIFGSTTDALRMQRRVEPMVEFKVLQDALNLFLNDHASNPIDASSLKDSLIWKVLKSKKGCKRQDLHVDAPEMQGETAAHNMRYSIIVSIMPGTKIILHDNSVQEIPLYGMIMFRGNYLHAGAGYDQVHYRIFIACHSIQFKPLDVDIVGLALKDDMPKDAAKKKRPGNSVEK